MVGIGMNTITSDAGILATVRILCERVNNNVSSIRALNETELRMLRLENQHNFF